jgi:hypothetical protein
MMKSIIKYEESIHARKFDFIVSIDLDVKWETFQKSRLPQIQQETIRKRDKYLQMQIHIEARTKNSLDPNDPDSNSSTD